MEKFPRGTLPPSTFTGIVRGTPSTVEAPPSLIDNQDRAQATAQAPRGSCDLAMMCPTCNTLMQPEHAHYRCRTCGYRDSCCF